MAKLLKNTLLLLVILMSIHIRFAEGRSQMDKYEWLPTESAYKRYPMSIIKGDLILNDGTSIYIPSRITVENGWGELGSIHIVGERLKPLPTKIEISWFSYTEDKFYSGVFELPFDRISYLFKKGVQSPVTGKKITYENIIVGVAPAGVISIWLMADGDVLLVANLKAKEEIMDWTYITKNDRIPRSTYIKRVLDRSLSKDQLSELNLHGVPYDRLEAFEKQYFWKPEVLGSKPTHLWLKTYNGECEFINFFPMSERYRDLRAIPKHIEIDWQDKFGKRYLGYITFDENEVLQAYQKISDGQKDHEMKLQIEINEKACDLNISLKDSKYILRLKKAVVKVYER
jgi:hypothetical protein